MEALLIVRSAVLLTGFIFTVMGGFKGLKWVKGTDASALSSSVAYLSVSISLLGVVMLFIALGNIFQFMRIEGAYPFTVISGLAGIGGVAGFLMAIKRITDFVVVG